MSTKSRKQVHEYFERKAREKAQELLKLYKEGNRPDKKKAREWDSERSRKQVHIHQPTINGTVSGTINSIGTINSVSGTINGGAFDLKRSDQGEQTKRDPHTKRDTKIEDYFQHEQAQPPHTPQHRIFSCGASKGSRNDESEAGLEQPCTPENIESSKRTRENEEQGWVQRKEIRVDNTEDGSILFDGSVLPRPPRPPNFIPSDDENKMEFTFE
ncbi:hypothetical protein RclHR1_14400005 [Rhizophagus clarus]|uniref:Uncharacterized protein n=1 Tax=Rhizophagus clarus TaxID=94130 RepID=A0A2Z6QCP6_9GLOM|nr:hypothetical protein RclHR1_14400005 [Rhizophagus clarus]